MKKRLFAIALSLILVISLAACSGNTPKDNENGGENSGSTGEPTYGGELIVGVTTDLDASLDPHVSSSSAGTREVLFNIFEGLVKPDAEGNLIPAVAESYSVNDTADEYTFVLREGIKFHNGNEVTTRDVVYSLSRAAGLTTGEPLVSDVAGIAAVEADDTTRSIKVTLSAPDTEFLAHVTTAIIPEDIDPATEAVGTGPFKLTGRTVQDNIVFEKFEDYWGEPAYLDKVTLKVIDNTETLVMSLKSGAVNMATHLISSQVNELTDMNILEGSSNAVQALYLNNDFEPFKDIRVRQALNYAIDQQSILDIAFDGHGSLLGSSMFPAFKKYFMPELNDLYPMDQEKAKELLLEAGQSDLKFSITVPSNMQQHVDTAQVIVEQLKAVGVTATINQVEWATWLEETYRGRKFESTIVSFDAHGVAASDLLARFQSDNGKNMINFKSEAYDAKYKEATSTTDDAAQTAAFKECERILAEEAANVYIQDVASFVALSKEFAGFQFYPLYVCDFATIYKTA
ncbi:MAG: ABC transporter substrate-binding protein [Firmicutes bacterium]|nr:ABC transporter substrate-binding protein [Bacillota bacterium]